MSHLFVAVTAHGYGHLAQVAPVIDALRARLPDLRVTLQSTLPAAVVHARLGTVRHLPQAADVALPMDGPLAVCWDEGLALYEAFEAEYDIHLARQQALLATERPALVLADVPWLPLDAARRFGIPAVALCSLNWYDILAEGPVGARLSPALAARLRTVYAAADLFIRPAPSMPMPWLPNARAVGPIAARRPRDPAGLRARLGLAPECQLVLMQFGGTGHVPLNAAFSLPGVHILTPDAAAATGPNRHLVGGPGLTVLEVLASCDALLTKPGYGTFAEAACNGVPVLYARRDDWPETAALVAWLARQVPTRAVTADDLAAGDIAAPLTELLTAAPVAPVAPTGARECAELLLPWLHDQ